MSEWRHQGKQVLQDGQHFADADGELEAMMIVNAMRALDGHRGGTVGPPERLPLVGEVSRETVMREPQPLEETPWGAVYCRPRREGDEYACSKGCGVRWSINEPAPRCRRAT